MNQSKLEVKQRKEKQQRIARLHKIRNKINKSVAVAGGMMPNDAPTIEDNDKIIVSVIEGPIMNKDGYTRLEDIQSTNGSVEDLNLAVGANPTFNKNDHCCSCSIM